jgi:Zn-dependent M28 family amino/carboxypeptidase
MRLLIVLVMLVASCLPRARSMDESRDSRGVDSTHVDTEAISVWAERLSTDDLQGRGPWTEHNRAVARLLMMELEALGARPLLGNHLEVPFVADARPGDTVYNVVGVLPARGGRMEGDLIGITAHLDHLGVGKPDASGDSIYNGFLDAALPMAMVLDVARRYRESPGDRPLIVMFFNLEEQGLLGSRALLARPDAGALIERLRLLIGVDAGSPAGEALEWQLMGALPAHPGARFADSLARARGWTTTPSAPRPISDVFPFSQRGVPILFPIPGKRWRGYTDAERTEAMNRFDHYHQPSDEWRADFPLVGTEHFADWLWAIVRTATTDAAVGRGR